MTAQPTSTTALELDAVEFYLVIDDPDTLQRMKQMFGLPVESWGDHLELQDLIIKHVEAISQRQYRKKHL
jgi:hypothetical protein